ncbi:phosphoserine phosphatase SerB [Arthrobacter cheniae]|uniref:phosphoserine phosphatase n=1 Tax=Arthrobacter cheniae TaxID=1258888 RepID=A0A3A5M7C6_9MICC|nr:phosphoserine phosphatase SerB [Arthrobacter cheniae]RJT76496.1 phosphoserine phosphatase SerB [Arthrobacter cheniae]
MSVDTRVVAFAPKLDDGHRNQLVTALNEFGAAIRNEAFQRSPTYDTLTLDLRLSTGPDVLRSVLTAWSSSSGINAAVVPAPVYLPGPKLLIMDVDSTLIKQEVIELLAAHAGREAEVAAVTEAAMRGELDFTQSLHHRVRALKGLPASVIDEVVGRIELSDGAELLVAAYLDAGHTVGVVSGGFSQVLGPLAARLRLSFARANDLEIEDGVLTGRVSGAVVDRREKERVLRAEADRAGVDLSSTIAVGDGANDLDMLAAAGLGVAFNAKPAVRAASDAALDLPDLDVVRHFAGL